MKDILERVIELEDVSNDTQVSQIIEGINKMPEAPSIKTLESVMKYYQRELKRLKSEDLLEWMNENDQTSFETEDCKVSIKTYVSTKVLDPVPAFKWLEEHQYGDLIKDTLDFPKGEFTTEVESALEGMGLSYTRKQGIHPQTLKKVMSDRLKDGEDLPDEDVGIKVGYFDECVVKKV